MPCSDGREPWAFQVNEENRGLKAKLDYVTALLCRQTKFLTKKTETRRLVLPDVADWYKDHKVDDDAREKKLREQLAKLDNQRQAILDQLAPEPEEREEAMGQ